MFASSFGDCFKSNHIPRVAGPSSASVGERLESAPLSIQPNAEMLNSQFNQMLGLAVEYLPSAAKVLKSIYLWDCIHKSYPA